MLSRYQWKNHPVHQQFSFHCPFDFFVIFVIFVRESSGQIKIHRYFFSLHFWSNKSLRDCTNPTSANQVKRQTLIKKSNDDDTKQFRGRFQSQFLVDFLFRDFSTQPMHSTPPSAPHNNWFYPWGFPTFPKGPKYVFLPLIRNPIILMRMWNNYHPFSWILFCNCYRFPRCCCPSSKFYIWSKTCTGTSEKH